MILAWMIYSGVVASVLGAAALVLEGCFARFRMSLRWVWVVSIIVTVVLPPAMLLRWRLLSAAPSTEAAAGVVMGYEVLSNIPWEGPSTVSTLLREWDLWFAGIWAILFLGILLTFWLAHRSLVRSSRTWRRTLVEGTPVWVSKDVGPAVVGVVAPRIVVPEWALRLDAERLLLMIRHEEEHVAAADPRLILLGLASAALMPWNPVLWWQLHRLRAAIEVDCDQRVLGAMGQPRVYASLLLDVGARAHASRLPVAALSERSSHLERRIRMMTRKLDRRRWVVLSAGTVVAGALLFVACELNPPVGPRPSFSSPPAGQASGSVTAVEDGPTFTPYDKRPELLNRAEFGRTLEERYPPELKEAGIGGTVLVWILIDVEGKVARTRVIRGSGHAELDAAADAGLQVARFSPAEHEGRPVAVWIQIPLNFQPRSAAPPAG